MRWGNYRLGFEASTVWIAGRKYLDRWFLKIFGFTVRLHRFHRGDDDRAVHDHPWSFITFPFKGYYERVHVLTWYTDEEFDEIRFVKPWRFHFRPAKYQHMVLGSEMRSGEFVTPKPFFTFVITGRFARKWGFWPDGRFVEYSVFQEFYGWPR